MELLVPGPHFASAVDDQRAARAAPIYGPVDDAADQADAGLLRGLSLGRRARPVHRLGVVVVRFLRRGAPRMERDLWQDGQVGAAIGGFREALAEPSNAIGLPEDLGDQRDRELAVGSGWRVRHLLSVRRG